MSPLAQTSATSAGPSTARSQPEGQLAAAAADLERLLDQGRLGGRGSVLTPYGLAAVTGHTARAMSYALRQLAAAGAVERSDGHWRIPDDRSGERSVRRARTVLEAMIGKGAYSVGRTLPSVAELSFTLLTERQTVKAALDELARRNILKPTGRSFTVTAPCQAPALADQLGAAALPRGHRRFPEVTTVPARFTVQHLRDTARDQWQNAEPLSPTALHQREILQRDLLRRLVLSARRHLGDQPRADDPVRIACARAVAVASCPMATLGERHWRYAVLATVLADLAGTLSPCSARP
ncbi:GntR family transcriptional regulator [Streptomyces rubiginosohelvolus]|uniref:GntR family transcriptional regulator n=1 Tax=Streptomyces rubiginosohelvolus TaxID=67362 RepID=UPI003686F94F